MKNTIILLTMLLFSGIGFAQESNNGKQLWAKSFLNEKAPELTVETWISKKLRENSSSSTFGLPGVAPAGKQFPSSTRLPKNFRKMSSLSAFRTNR